MTTFCAAYDTESVACLEAVRRIVDVHERFRMPATFFIVAELLDTPQGAEYRRLIGGNPLFEIASHSYTHMLLREHRVCGKPGPSDLHAHEIIDSKKRIEDCFGRVVAGFRSPVGFSDGLQGAPHLLALCQQAGYRYSSSLLWGPQESLPALVREPFAYAKEGHPGLWEVPAFGWHENVLKGFSGSSLLVQLYPAPIPEAAAIRFITTPAEEIAVHRAIIDHARAAGCGHASLIWHPWSLHRFDPEMTMLQGVFQYVRDCQMPVGTFADYTKGLSQWQQST
jgi:hypothetical protein